MSAPYDALLVVSFGGPEGPDEVLPFLENVLRGRRVPRQRMLEVAEHYQRFGGVSPLNQQNRDLISALQKELALHGRQLPIYWGNRNWHPFLPEALIQMRDAGVRRALAFFTSAYSSYSGCRQYRENIREAQVQVGPDAPQVEKLRAYFNHPGFIEPSIERVATAMEQILPERRSACQIVFTAHSLPLEMAKHCAYQEQLTETCRLIAEGVGHPDWRLVYQSRSGPPRQPWLEPDVCDHLQALREQGREDAVVMPAGFISDHMEVIYDLDVEAKELCDSIGLNMVRAKTVGIHARFVTMIRELITERIEGWAERSALGNLPPSHDVCPEDCCLYQPVARPTH